MIAPRSSEGTPSLLSIDDLSDADIRSILERAAALSTYGKQKRQVATFSVGLLFLQPSLRTRLGFAEAALRLGGTAFDISGQRYTEEMSAPESFGDTLRIVSGMVDLVVLRTPYRLPRVIVLENAVCPVINGGDGDGEHPSQALVDLAMIETAYGDPQRLRVGICGDLRSRAARSLLSLLARRRPREVRLMAPPSRCLVDPELLARLAPSATGVSEPAFDDLDVLYMTGLTARRGDEVLPNEERRRFALTAEAMRTLPAGAMVLCPMPAIDEIDPAARADRRLRMFEQSDRGTFVRMALIERALGLG